MSGAATVTVNGTFTLPAEQVRVAGSVRAALEAELAEVRRRHKHYSRQITSLELQLEKVDREQQRTYRRIAQLEEALLATAGRALVRKFPSGTLTPRQSHRSNSHV